MENQLEKNRERKIETGMENQTEKKMGNEVELGLITAWRIGIRVSFNRGPLPENLDWRL